MKRKHNRSGLAGLLLLSFISACASPAQLHSATSPPTIPPPQITATIQSSTETPPLARTPTLPPSPPLGPTTIGRVENFVQVGHTDLKSRGWNAGLALNYPCAYIGNRNPDIAIVDVSDPKNPSLVGELATPPNGQPVELRAVPDLGLLVVANLSPTASVLTYDVSDCRHPKPLGSLGLSAVPHEFFLWRDSLVPPSPGGVRGVARLLMFAAMFHDRPDLQVVDLSDPSRPQRVATWTAAEERARGTLHSLSVSRDGRRAYLALWDGGFLVADSSDFQSPMTNPQLRLIRDPSGFSPALGQNVHSAVLLTDPRYVLLTQEVYECPFAGVMIADVANEARPQSVGRFELPENDPACDGLPQADAVFTAHNPLVVGNLVFLTWYGGGLQVLDVSDVTQPRRVGLFVPNGEGAASRSYVGTYPVQMWSYPILREGLIYAADIQSGLYILEYTGPGAEEVKKVALAEGNAATEANEENPGTSATPPE